MNQLKLSEWIVSTIVFQWRWRGKFGSLFYRSINFFLPHSQIHQSYLSRVTVSTHLGLKQFLHDLIARHSIVAPNQLTQIVEVGESFVTPYQL